MVCSPSSGISLPYYCKCYPVPTWNLKQGKQCLFRYGKNLICSMSLLGTFPDAQLPSKRIIGPKNYEFLKSKREEFQEYLQVSVLWSREYSKTSHLRLTNEYLLFLFSLLLINGLLKGFKCTNETLTASFTWLKYILEMTISMVT